MTTPAGESAPPLLLVLLLLLQPAAASAATKATETINEVGLIMASPFEFVP
jgi:hypothetical protein